jgi:hypothetical protein
MVGDQSVQPGPNLVVCLGFDEAPSAVRPKISSGDRFDGRADLPVEVQSITIRLRDLTSNASSSRDGTVEHASIADGGASPKSEHDCRVRRRGTGER